MKLQWMYVIYYRSADGQILRYITNDKELYKQELTQLRQSGRQIVQHWKVRL